MLKGKRQAVPGWTVVLEATWPWSQSPGALDHAQSESAPNTDNRAVSRSGATVPGFLEAGRPARQFCLCPLVTPATSLSPVASTSAKWGDGSPTCHGAEHRERGSLLPGLDRCRSSGSLGAQEPRVTVCSSVNLASLQGKLSVLQRGSKHSFVEGERLVPQPHSKADAGSQQSALGWAARPGLRLAHCPHSQAQHANRQHVQPQTGCAPTSCLGASCAVCCRETILSRSSLASNATSSRKSSPRLTPQAWPSASCWRLPAHHSAPLSPRPRVCVPANVRLEKLLTETKDQAGLSHQEQPRGQGDSGSVRPSPAPASNWAPYPSQWTGML